MCWKCNKALKEHSRTQESAWKEYYKIYMPALKKYEKKVNLAWEKYFTETKKCEDKKR